ncbi:MAG: pilin [Candidatus Gracilibacteria bacterium]|nr:pilin [Candidatus Gracilibacteria bacterium]
MNNVIKNGLYTLAGLSLGGLANVTNAIDITGSKSTTTGDSGQSGDLITTLDNILGYALGLLYFIAVIFALYGGFQILTAGGDEDKVKKGKTTLINAVIGLVVIFLASIIIRWVISLTSTVIK